MVGKNFKIDSKVYDDDMINSMIENNKYEFSVTETEEGGMGLIVTKICNFGGCAISTIECENLFEAKKKAVIMTLNGQRPEIGGVCSECRSGEADSIICAGCGGWKEPVYDEHPDLVRYCPTCG